MSVSTRSTGSFRSSLKRIASAPSPGDEAALLANPPRSDPRRLAARVEGPTTHAVLRGHLQATAMAVAPVGADGTEGLSPDLQTVTGRKPVAEATGSAGPEQAARSAIHIIIRLHLLGVP